MRQLMEFHPEYSIDEIYEKLPKYLKEDTALLEECYSKGEIFNPVFDYFEPDVKAAIRAGRITDAEAKILLLRYDLW